MEGGRGVHHPARHYRQDSVRVLAVPQVSIAQTYLKIMNKFAEQFGLTPSSRSRIIASDGGPADATDEIENLLGGGGS